MTSACLNQTPKSIREILTEIRHRRRVNPSDFGFADSTELIREDRDTGYLKKQYFRVM